MATLLELARKIDAQAAGDAKPDFVSIPSYLKFCEALYLTPASREKLKPEEARPVGKLDELKAKRAKREEPVDPIDELRAARKRAKRTPSTAPGSERQ